MTVDREVGNQPKAVQYRQEAGLKSIPEHHRMKAAVIQSKQQQQQQQRKLKMTRGPSSDIYGGK